MIPTGYQRKPGQVRAHVNNVLLAGNYPGMNHRGNRCHGQFAYFTDRMLKTYGYLSRSKNDIVKFHKKGTTDNVFCC
jgi:hypothetical protein